MRVAKAVGGVVEGILRDRIGTADAEQLALANDVARVADARAPPGVLGAEPVERGQAQDEELVKLLGRLAGPPRSAAVNEAKSKPCVSLN